MTVPDDEETWELLEEEYLPADAMPRLEEAIRRADARRDLDLAFRLRLRAFERGYPDVRKFVAFSWCLAHFNSDPERFAFATANVIAGLNWIAAVAYAYPQFTLEQIWGMLEQLRDLRQRYGLSLRPVYEKIWRTALHVGDQRRMRRYHTLWTKAPRGDRTFCSACEAPQWVEYWAYQNKHDRAVAAGEPILTGRSCLNCRGALPWSLNHLLRSLVLAGRTEEAEACHRRSHRLLARERDGNLYLSALADQLAYVGHSANFGKAAALLEKHLLAATTTDDIDNRYRFYMASSRFLHRVAEHKETLSLRLPRSFPLRIENGRYDPKALAVWFDEQAAPLGVRFDQRNGNHRYTKMVRQSLQY
ncbi:MAG TPA: hypothetical protein VH575_02055 [Gemmataceae bacterium]|jgi:hypothetical protein